jgi:hypothetical protein
MAVGTYLDRVMDGHTSKNKLKTRRMLGGTQLTTTTTRRGT